jgi:acyl carrier protein
MMSHEVDTVRQSIRRFITDNFLFGRCVELSDSASFLQNGLLDSTGMLELLSFLEQEHAVNIRPEEVVPENLDSVDCITAFLHRKLHANGVAREEPLQQGGADECAVVIQ